VNSKATGERWAICKAMSALTGLPSQTLFSIFSSIDESIANAALTQADNNPDSTAVNALRDHVSALISKNITPPAQPLPPQEDQAPVPDKSVEEYTQRLRLALWLIVQCGGVKQATFILEQAAKAYPEDTGPAFAPKTK
jgi:hypothetical protein